MHTMRGIAVLAAASMALTGLAACGGDVEPKVSTSTKSPRTPVGGGRATDAAGSSSTPDANGATTLELPEQAKPKSEAGAIAFNEFYYEEKGNALKTGKTDLLQRYAENCEVCDEYIRIVDESTSQGIKMDKNPNEVRDVSAKERTDGGYRVELTIDASAYHEILPNGSTGRTAEALTYTAVTDTQWVNGHWTLHDWVLIR